MTRARTLTSLLVIAIAGFAAAQTDTAYQRHVADIEILQVKAVQQELKITEAQRIKLNGHADWYNGQVQKAVKDAGANPTDAKQREAATKIAAAQRQLKDRVLAVLTATQLKRLAEVSLQALGILAVLDETVAKRIGLSAAQITKIKESWNETGKKVADVEKRTREPIYNRYKDRKPKDEAEAKRIQAEYEQEMEAVSTKNKPEIDRLKSEFEKSVDETLTAGQKKTWEALRGAPFKP